MKIYVEEGNLKATKSCEICVHVDSCKFYSKAKTLFTSNEFYEMSEYSEWNNNLKAWSENKNCQYYVPFLFDRKFFEIELKKNKSFINAYDGWWELIKQYFIETLKKDHEEYFKTEMMKQREKYFSKGMSDENLFSRCIKRSSSNRIYKISANDDSWYYEFKLTDVLEYFNAFKEID